jgi:hypothetical protein
MESNNLPGTGMHSSDSIQFQRTGANNDLILTNTVQFVKINKILIIQFCVSKVALDQLTLEKQH